MVFARGSKHKKMRRNMTCVRDGSSSGPGLRQKTTPRSRELSIELAHSRFMPQHLHIWSTKESKMAQCWFLRPIIGFSRPGVCLRGKWYAGAMAAYGLDMAFSIITQLIIDHDYDHDYDRLARPAFLQW